MHVARGGDIEWLTRLLGGVPQADAKADGSRANVLAAFPTAARPRVLVPLGSRRAAAASVPGASSRRLVGRLVRASSAIAMRSGLPQRLLRHRMWLAPVADGALSLVDYFGEIFERDVEIAVRVPPRRPNRKPLLQVLTEEGDVIGYAKVGWNELTRSLVANESAVLQALDGRPGAPREFEAPRVIHFGQWGDLDLLVLSPLSLGRERIPLQRVARASAAVASLTPLRRSVLAESQFWLDARARAAQLDGGLGHLAAAIERRYGDAEIEIGGWHGDWATWNMGCSESALAVWDWERSRGAAPVGLDAVHFDYHAALTGRRARRSRSAVDVVLDGPGLLSAIGVPRRERRLLLSLHLLEMALRWEEGRQAGMGVADEVYRPTLDALMASAAFS